MARQQQQHAPSSKISTTRAKDDDENYEHLRRSPHKARNFASRRSSYSDDSAGSSIDIPIAVAMNKSSIDGVDSVASASRHASLSEPRPCNRYGFFVDSEEAAASELPVPNSVTKRREAKWLKMLASERKWSKHVVNNYKKVRDRCRKGIPHAIRGKAWLHLCGGHKKMRTQAGLFDSLDKQDGVEVICDQIKTDLNRQFPNHEMFADVNGYGQNDLYRVLKAYSIMRPKTGYCQGQAPLAAVLLMHQPAEEAFWTFLQLCDFFLPGYFDHGLEALQLHGDMLLALLKKFYPSAYKLLKKQNMEPTLFMTEWFMCLFCRTLPWPVVLRVWDMFMCEGVRVIFKVAIVMLGSLLGSNTPERKQCVDMCATLTALRNYPIKYLDEKEFIDKVIKLDLTEKQLHHEHAVQTTNRRAKKALQDKQRQAATAALNNGTGTRSQHKNGTSNGSTHSTPSKPMNGVRPSAASGSAPDVPSRGSRNGSASGNGTTRSRSASNSSAQQNGRSRRKGSSQR